MTACMQLISFELHMQLRQVTDAAQSLNGSDEGLYYTGKH